MSGMLVDVPLRVLRCTARVATITVQSIHFAAPSTHPVEGWPAAHGRCAAAAGAFEGFGGGAWEASGAVDGGGEAGLAFGGALYSGWFVPAFRQLRLSPPCGRLQVGHFNAWVETFTPQS